MRRNHPPGAPQRDLFGNAHKTAARDHTPVTLALREHPAGHTDKAWLLSTPQARAAPKHAARALVSRGDKPGQEQFFTMPRWLAAERGWL